MSIDLMEVLRVFGFPTLILVAVGMAFWRFMSWVGKEVYTPVRERLLDRINKFFENLDETIGNVNVNIVTMTKNLDRLSQSIENTEKMSERILLKVDAWHEVCKISNNINLASSEETLVPEPKTIKKGSS